MSSVVACLSETREEDINNSERYFGDEEIKTSFYLLLQKCIGSVLMLKREDDSVDFSRL